MKRAREMSDLDDNRIFIRPGRLLCLRCLNGGGRLPFMEDENLPGTLSLLKSNPLTHVGLHTSFDEMGARTAMFAGTGIAERKRDLDVLQRLGLSPGDVRMSQDLFSMIQARIKDVSGICGYGGAGTRKWPACPLSAAGCYQKGAEGFISLKDRKEMARWKRISCAEIEKSGLVVIRSHHILCIICFFGKEDGEKGLSPLPQDNLYEVLMKMRKKPSTPVRLIEGAGGCVVCPPCHSFDNERGLCVAACHLRDRRKDAETFRRLDMLPGETLSARELVETVRARIPDLGGICLFDEETAPQWKSCGSGGTYRKGLAKKFFET